MKHLIIIGLILLAACDANVGSKSSNDDNSIINQDVRCQECGKKETLIEFGYEDIICTGFRCPVLPGGGIDEQCDRDCIEERNESRVNALNACYASYNCSQSIVLPEK